MKKAKRQFLVVGLPRSRTTWLANFLAGPDCRVGHDTLLECDKIEDFTGLFSSRYLGGSCETAGMLAWKLIRHQLPELKIVLVRRDKEEVKKSLRQCGWPNADVEIDTRDAMLDAMALAPRVVSFQFSELYDPEVCQKLFEYCRGESWDFERWQELAAQNIQIDMAARARRIAVRAPQISALKASVFAQCSRLGGASCLGLH